MTDHYDYWNTRSARLTIGEVVRLSHILRGISEVLYDKKAHPGELTICDFGCGRGWLSHELCKIGEVTGVDYSEAGIEQAKRLYSDVHSFVRGDVLTWHSEEKFDIVVSSEVIEHVVPQDLFLETIKDVLKPRGYLVLTTPNMAQQELFFATGYKQQPIEKWLSRFDLCQLLLRLDFCIHLQYTFDQRLRHDGLYQLVVAQKL